MAATLMQLRRLVRSRLGIPISDDFMPDRVLDDSINLAVQTIDAEGPWPWSDVAETVTIDAAHPDIVPKPDWRATRAVLVDNDELACVSSIDLLRYLNAASDAPAVWSPIGDVVAVRPTPSTAVVLTHLYYRQSAWLRDDEDVPYIPEQYSGAIVAKAAELLAARESSAADATRHANEFNAWINRMRSGTRTATGPTRTRVRPGSWV